VTLLVQKLERKTAILLDSLLDQLMGFLTDFQMESMKETAKVMLKAL
jgi:hypothetical protein